MAPMEKIQQLARELGEAVAHHERFAAFREARTAFRADEEAQALQRDYDAAADLIQRKSALGQPLEPEDKRAEAGLREKVAANAVLMQLLRAQADFHELMREVNQTIEDALEQDAAQ